MWRNVMSKCGERKSKGLRKDEVDEIVMFFLQVTKITAARIVY